VALVALAALLVATVVGAYFLTRKPTPSTVHLFYAVTATSTEGFPATPPDGLIDEAVNLVKAGPVSFQIAVGASAAVVTPSLPLRQNIDGGAENDSDARRAEVESTVTKVMGDVPTAAKALSDGRSLLNLINTVSGSLGSGTNVIYLATLGLPTAPGEDARLLMNTDPEQAAMALPGTAISSLHGAIVHVLLLPGAGSQAPINAVTDHWRKAFISAVLKRANAHVADINVDSLVEKPMKDAPSAPAVPDLTMITHLPQVTGDTTTIKLDTAEAFLPDSAQWATGEASIKADLQPIAAAWANARRHGKQLTITVTGHCARFGPPAGARLLSQQRAQAVAQELNTMGVPVTSDQVRGTGFDDPLPDPKHPQSSANRAVIVSVHS
jgi:outer membrane protein OmpA-like peptidoglycan-associated protein